MIYIRSVMLQQTCRCVFKISDTCLVVYVSPDWFNCGPSCACAPWVVLRRTAFEMCPHFGSGGRWGTLGQFPVPFTCVASGAQCQPRCQLLWRSRGCATCVLLCWFSVGLVWGGFLDVHVWSLGRTCSEQPHASLKTAPPPQHM